MTRNCSRQKGEGLRKKRQNVLFKQGLMYNLLGSQR